MPDTPREVVEEFFNRMSDDRRETVDELFADDATLRFPGGEFTGPDAADDMLAYLGPRYEWVEKDFGCWIATGPFVVSLGTLYGVNNDAEDFEGIRYVDIYKVRDGEIERLEVFNDLPVEDVL